MRNLFESLGLMQQPCQMSQNLKTAGAEVDVAMGGQSQHHKKPTQRVQQWHSHHLKCSRSQGQKTFVGGKAFNPETDCPICRAKALNGMLLAASSPPQQVHQEVC